MQNMSAVYLDNSSVMPFTVSFVPYQPSHHGSKLIISKKILIHLLGARTMTYSEVVVCVYLMNKKIYILENNLHVTVLSL